MNKDQSKPHEHRGECNVVTLVVIFIGIFALVGLLGIIIFLTVAVLKDKPIEATSVALLTSLGTLCGTAVGSLGSMLNQTRAESRSVTVDNKPNDPIPVDPTPPPSPPKQDP